MQHINYLFDLWCEYIVIACNTAVASIYKHWFEIDKEKRLISVTSSGVKKAIRNNAKNIAVLCTQATHDLWVYPLVYQQLEGAGRLYTVPTPELVPLIESEDIDYDRLVYLIEKYQKYIDAETDTLILWCTHYPLLLDIFWEKFSMLDIVDPGRGTLFTLEKRLNITKQKKCFGRGNVRILCTGQDDVFLRGAKRIWKTDDLPEVVRLVVS